MANLTIEELLQVLVDHGGSDLHLSAGSPPKIRVDGSLHDLSDTALSPEATKALIYSFLTGDQIARFEKTFELDMSFGSDEDASVDLDLGDLGDLGGGEVDLSLEPSGAMEQPSEDAPKANTPANVTPTC